MSGRLPRLRVARPRIGIILAALTALAAVLLLSGCSAQAAVDPLTPEQSARLRVQLLDRMWAKVRVKYPGVLRPEIGSTLLVADRDWRGDVSDCMRAKGFTVTRQSEGAMPSFGGTEPESSAVADYACSGQFVTAATVSTVLSDDQYSALRGYYVGFVRPCLLGAGARSDPPPGESGFVGDERTREWNPYQQVWASALSSDAVNYLESRCPPAPRWLSLAGE